MRHVGTLPPGRPAGGLLAALAARGLEVELREGEIWLLDEDRLPEAATELERFRRDPEHPDWRRAVSEALARCEEETGEAQRALAERSRRAWRRERRLRRAWQGAASSRPLTLLLLAAGGLAGAAGSHEVTALLPLLVSLYWLHELGTHVEALRGSRRYCLLILSLAGTSQFVLSSVGFGSAGLFGIGFGLLGFTAARASLSPEAGLSLPRGLLSSMALWLLACAAGAAPASVFLAQCVGLLVGLFIGTVPAIVRRLGSASPRGRVPS